MVTTLDQEDPKRDHDETQKGENQIWDISQVSIETEKEPDPTENIRENIAQELPTSGIPTPHLNERIFAMLGSIRTLIARGQFLEARGQIIQ
jgi:hypothetical protein